jgi:hypothetical protein
MWLQPLSPPVAQPCTWQLDRPNLSSHHPPKKLRMNLPIDPPSVPDAARRLKRGACHPARNLTALRSPGFHGNKVASG